MPKEIDNNLYFRRQTLQQCMVQEVQGCITGLTGLTAEAVDFPVPIGGQCQIITRNGEHIAAEVIGFRDNVSVLMPLGEMFGIAAGDIVVCQSAQSLVPVGNHLLGRVINAAGEPIDGKGPLLCQIGRSISAPPLQALQRRRINTPFGTGIKSIDAMMSCGQGQRMGIFSGPGVGKSVLMGMIARYTSADINVIGLVGERGREVREFIEKELGSEGLARSVVVVSTSDEPAPVRVRAGFVATTIAEYFRDKGRNVLLLMDSVTRIAMAQRQIGLAMGEPPATRGYTPSVFALLPKLLERCGCGSRGSITGFYTVLVEGDDLSEPIADAMRGILDGHLWLSRSLANRGHYPAIDILESISRVMPDVADEDHLQAARLLVHLTAIYRDIEDLVNIGAYAQGTNPEYDLAVQSRPEINAFLQQEIQQSFSYEQSVAQLKELARRIAGSVNTSNAGRENNEQENTESKSQSAAQLERMMAGL